MPSLERITVYPIKSLDGHALASCPILPNGALANDRRYALVDGQGNCLNGKRFAAVHTLRATFSDDLREVTLSAAGQQQSFCLSRQAVALAAWCAEVLGQPCRLVESAAGGFPDDTDAPGPTLVSTASLESVTGWFESRTLEETRRRFRFNLEVTATPPFWEDQLASAVRFRVGAVTYRGCTVCARCVVPTRDSRTGEVDAGFVHDFSRQRASLLPPWAPAEAFGHFYRLGLNTKIDSIEAVVRVGDPVELAPAGR